MNNKQNARIYRRWAPIYDRIVGRWAGLNRARERSFALAGFRSGERVLLIGVGTGLDLPLLPREVEVTGVDLSPEMLDKARSKAGDRSVRLFPMNAERLTFREETFDVTVLHLILSVVENPRQALAEAVRVLRPGGRMLILDKFVPNRKRPSWFRRILNHLTRRLGTDINRSWESWVEGLPVQVRRDEPAWLGGSYRIILLEKTPQG